MRTYQIESRGDSPKYYFLYKEIRRDILSGAMKQGEKLPSKRTLAEHLGISLITVENAYQLLKDEGYIETRERSGYYICEVHGNDSSLEPGQTLQLLALPDPQERETDNPVEEIPYSLYFRTIRSVMSTYGPELLRRSPGEGCAILRNSISSYLLRYRGIYAQPEQIIIGSGAENLYACVLRMFGKQRIYGIEDPSYSQIQRVYEGSGASVEKLPMGKNGIEKQALSRTHADILHVTPFHSFPSGVTAPITKRYEYLEWAAEGDRYIVEDDFDSEFFMPGIPIQTLFMLDDSGSVIYINTFSKSLSPSMRMGYMILPQRLLELYHRTNDDFSCTVPVLDQYALAEFIDKGYFEQHLNRVRRRRSASAENKNGAKTI